MLKQRQTVRSRLSLTALLTLCILVLASPPASAQTDANEEATTAIQLRVVSPDGEPVPGARIGTGLNVFEVDEERGPPQIKTMWAINHRRTWSWYTDGEGQAVLTADEPLKALYVRHDARGLVGIKHGPFEGEQHVTIQLQPACLVRGKIQRGWNSDRGEPLDKTVAWLESEKIGRDLRIYYVSHLGRFEFVLPPGQYSLRAMGRVAGAAAEEEERSFKIEPGQRDLDLGTTELPQSRLASLIGKPAPELEGIRAWRDGKALSLSGLRGKVVLLDFWGYWCDPCIYTMPHLMDQHEKYADRGLTIISVHDNSQVDSMAELEEKLEPVRERVWDGRKLPFAVALDGEGKHPIPGSDRTARGPVHAAYGVNSWPTYVLIDREGRVVTAEREVFQKIEALLGEANETK